MLVPVAGVVLVPVAEPRPVVGTELVGAVAGGSPGWGTLILAGPVI
jgi:hypothetical protein